MITDTLNASPPATKGLTKESYRHLFVPYASYKLLLAIDNDDNAPAAIRITAALSHRGANTTVLRTVPLMAPVSTGTAADATFLYTQAALSEEFYEAQERVINNTIRNILGRQPAWPVITVIGEPGSTIVSEAEECDAELLVMGIHHHGNFSQALGENTATRVMAKASMPILGVRPDTRQLPRTVMVATDFGKASWEAAHVAANLVDPSGVVILAHVASSSPVVEEGDEGAALVQREGIEHAFNRLADEIKAGKTIRVETVTREGDPGTELLAAARQINPDIVASARQRHGFISRLMLGSVTRKLVRDGNWSMLITPPLRTQAKEDE